MQFNYLCDGCRAEFSADSSVWNDGSRLCHLLGGIDRKSYYIWLADLHAAANGFQGYKFRTYSGLILSYSLLQSKERERGQLHKGAVHRPQGEQ